MIIRLWRRVSVQQAPGRSGLLRSGRLVIWNGLNACLQPWRSSRHLGTSNHRTELHRLHLLPHRCLKARFCAQGDICPCMLQHFGSLYL